MNKQVIQSIQLEEKPTKLENIISRNKKIRKSNSPSINMTKKLSKSPKSKSPKIKNQELEWVVCLLKYFLSI
jgi:hypothetical protein